MSPRFSGKDARRPADKTTYTVAWCADCDFGRLEANLVPQAVAAFYEIDDYYTRSVIQRPAQSLLDKVLAHLAWRMDKGQHLEPPPAPNKGATMCDIGCGGGRLMGAFAAAGYGVYGVDPDQSAMAFTKFNTVYVGTAEQMPNQLAAMSFDVVLMSHSLEHCIDPIKAIQNCACITKPGGRIIIEVPNNAAIGLQKHGAVWPFADLPRHLSYFTSKSLQRAVSRFATVTDVSYAGFNRQFFREWIERQKANAAAMGRQGSYEIDAWFRLARGLVASDDQKYDSVRVVATMAQPQS